MAAAEPVRPGDALVLLPRDAALLAAPGQECPFPGWIAPAFWDAKPWCAAGVPGGPRGSACQMKCLSA